MSASFVEEDQSMKKTEQRTGYGSEVSLAIGIAKAEITFIFQED